MQEVDFLHTAPVAPDSPQGTRGASRASYANFYLFGALGKDSQVGESWVHIAVDWPGDPGFKSGALSYCAMSVVVSETTEEIDTALQDVRTRRHMHKGFEFKFARTNEPGKIAFMEAIAQTSFTGIVVIYNKNAMDPPWAWGKNDALLAQLLMRALLQLPRAAIENAKMIITSGAS